MSESRFDSRPGTRSNEVVYLGKTPWRVCAQLVLLGLATAFVAWAFAASEAFRNLIWLERNATQWAAALSGGAATIFFTLALWIWNTRIRWVAVSIDGLRWLRGPRARLSKWQDYLGVHRGSIETTVWGEELKTGRYADVEFRTGRRLRISTNTIQGYEDLIAEIQTTAAEAQRLFFPIGGSRCGGSGVVSYGPLQFDCDGLVWDRNHYRWDEIEAYEVAVGYLRIQPVKGTEFLRRLCELGDWKPALSRLDDNIGSRRVQKSPSGQKPAQLAQPA